MQFAACIGVEETAARLRAGVHSGRVAHAMLFEGKEGSSALGLARAYAAYLHCASPTESDSCGTCTSCKAHAALQHPDLHWSFPFFKADGEETATSGPFLPAWRDLLRAHPYFGLEEWVGALGADKKQLFIGVHEALEINRKLGLKAFNGGYKVLIVWLPELMRSDTANKMLKLIEEPTEHTVMLFVSEHPESLLATVRSRVQAVRVPRLDDAAAAAAIGGLTGLAGDAALELAHATDGNLAAAVRLASAEGATSDHDAFVRWMRACYALDTVALAACAEGFSKDGRESMKRFCLYGLHMVRQCIVGNYGASEVMRLTARERAFAEKFAPFIHHGNVQDLQGAFERAHRDIAGNVNGKLVFLELGFLTHGLLRRPV
jgi:DNA polymerase-3 subunit delta'